MRYPRAASSATRPTRLAAGACAVAAVLIAGAPVLQSAPASALPAHQSCAGDCNLGSRIAAVDSYLAGRPGTTGYVVRDRVTGNVYSNGNAESMFWTASTIKLAIAEDVINRARVGAIVFTPEDRRQLESMLATSNDAAADYLWNKYAGPDRMAFVNAFRANGMTGLTPHPTTDPRHPFPDWGFLQASPADLDRLMNNVLDTMHPDDRGYLLDRMRSVDTNQHWGVWGAGDGMRPGLKNGWSDEQGGWVVNSVGFAGPDERFTVAIMNDVGNQGGYTDGEQTTTHVAELLFR
ncbi:tat pathway signal sequence [Nocardia wallacei]|uniref:tat pathway signal sequence n=1 Tax=Nocardia wallacei TaxID=480035 RepID=UPI002458FB5E|nr:tat pathway signal sequence [Nocardia wallacei]